MINSQSFSYISLSPGNLELASWCMASVPEYRAMGRVPYTPLLRAHFR